MADVPSGGGGGEEGEGNMVFESDVRVEREASRSGSSRDGGSGGIDGCRDFVLLLLLPCVFAAAMSLSAARRDEGEGGASR